MKNSCNEKALFDSSRDVIVTLTGLLDADLIPLFTHQR
jgi:hypothetical protein